MLSCLRNRFSEQDMKISDDMIQFARSIEAELPQTAAVLLFSLSPAEAGMVLRELPAGLAIELAERIVHTGDVSPELLQKLYEGCGSFDFFPQNLNREKTGLLLEVLPYSGYLRQREIIQGLEELFSLSLAFDDIRMIEDLLHIEKSRLAEILGEAEQNDITLALRIAGEETREKVLLALESDRAAEIRSDLDWGSGVLMSDVEGASERLLKYIKEKI